MNLADTVCQIHIVIKTIQIQTFPFLKNYGFTKHKKQIRNYR